MRLLAVTAANRVPGFDGVPALAETMPGFEMTGWFAIVAPKGTPAAVLQRANKDVNALLNEREFAERIAPSARWPTAAWGWSRWARS